MIDRDGTTGSRPSSLRVKNENILKNESNKKQMKKRSAAIIKVQECFL